MAYQNIYFIKSINSKYSDSLISQNSREMQLLIKCKKKLNFFKYIFIQCIIFDMSTFLSIKLKYPNSGVVTKNTYIGRKVLIVSQHP